MLNLTSLAKFSVCLSSGTTVGICVLWFGLKVIVAGGLVKNDPIFSISIIHNDGIVLDSLPSAGSGAMDSSFLNFTHLNKDAGNPYLAVVKKWMNIEHTKSVAEQ